MLSVYCCGWDLKDLLLKGFTGAYGKVQSGPAKHFRTALGQVVNFFYTLQGEAAGAQAFASFDTLLAPFIRYDGSQLRRGQAVAAGVHLQHERADPGRLPDPLHQHHPRHDAAEEHGERGGDRSAAN